MFLRKSENAIPYFKSKIYMRLGLLMTAIAILVLGIYSPLYDYIYELSKNLY
jgi:NADH-quinone oxidoreductase subunit N